jgi:predicted Zn-dependent protease
MSQYLLAQVAVRRGENDEAIRYLERAWQLGDHGASVAVQLFSLLVEAGRKGDANRYIAQLGDLPLVSPGLFDRVMPLFFQTGRSNQAVARARKWVEENPQDAQAYVRLGRTLLLYASTQSNDDEKAKQLAASESAFRDALRLSPDDVSTWTSLFAFLLQTQRPLEAAELLEKFARDAKTGPVEKELLLARLYGAIPRPALSVMHWRRAVRQASEQADHAKELAALSQAATYFAAVSPPLAESYCRQALELDSPAPGPMMLLADLLSTRADPKALDEAITLAERASRLPGPSAVTAQLLWARLLTQRNGTGDANRVISLLESKPIKDNDEKLLLASNYSRIGRQGAAYEFFDDVATTATPRVGDLAAYLEFWQADFQADGRFTNRVQEVLDRFGEVSQGLPEKLRWMIQLAQTAGGENTTTSQPISSILAEFWVSPRVAKLLADDRSSQSLLYGVLYVLLDQGHVDEAVELCRHPPGKTSPAFAARLLANTIMAHRLGDAAQVSAGEKLLDDSIAANPNDLLLLQDAGDLAALSGHAARAEAMYQRVLAIDPSHSSATGNLVALLSGDPARRHESLQIVDEALAEHPSDATLLNAKGQVLLSMDRVREAIATLVEAAQQDPLNASVYLRLARAHDQLSEANEAQEALLITSAMGIDQQPLPNAEQQALVELRKKYKL